MNASGRAYDDTNALLRVRRTPLLTRNRISARTQRITTFTSEECVIQISPQVFGTETDRIAVLSELCIAESRVFRVASVEGFSVLEG